MDTCMQGVPWVQCFMDDIIVSGHTEEECFQNLDISFQRLKDADFQLHKFKCSFLKPELTIYAIQLMLWDVTHLRRRSEPLRKHLLRRL